MSQGSTEPKQGRHVFVVLRHDSFVSDLVEAITATKAFATKVAADAEAERLNTVNADKGARYFVRLVRLQDEPEAG